MDSQEFLTTLLDALHEDLNANGHLKSKALPEISSSIPEAEAAATAHSQHKQQNDSIIVDLFAVGHERCHVLCHLFECYLPVTCC